MSDVANIRAVKHTRWLGNNPQKVGAILDWTREAEINGELVSETLGTYNKERFPESRQGFRPFFDRAIGQFAIYKQDGKLWSQTDANECVKKIPLQYPKYHRKEGEAITEANIRDLDDPYFNHKAFVRIAEEGELDIMLGTDKDKVLLDMYSGMEGVIRETGTDAHPGDASFMIADPEVRENKAEAYMSQSLDAHDLFKAMQDDVPRMRQILRLFNDYPDENMSPKTLRTHLYNKYVKDEVTTEKGVPYQKLFVEYASMPKDELELFDLCKRAVNQHEIKEKPGIYDFMGQNIGATFSAVVNFFSQSKNHASLQELKAAMAKYEEV